MVQTGWTVVDDDQAEGRPLGEILNPSPSFGERQIGRLEGQAAEAEATRRADAVDEAETQAWMARMRGHEARSVDEVLAERAGLMDREASSRPSSGRVQRARDILARHGLDDVLPPNVGRVILDANMGTLELDRYAESRAAVARVRQERDERKFAEMTRAISQDRAFIARVEARHRGEVTR